MYHEYHQFEVMPFENTPNPRFFFASEHHREALAAIEYTVRMRKGIVLITGDVGSGKTTVCRTMQDRCRQQATVVELLHGSTTGFEFARQLLRKLNVEVTPQDDHPSLLAKLQEYLLAQARIERPVVLFVDEAQALTDEALEEIRLLTNFDTADEKLIQLALVGQPELRDRIAGPRLSALRQRIVMAKRLRPLNLNETGDYIRHRIRAASKNPENVIVEVTDEAVNAIYDQTGGIPRLTNVVCDNCLLLAYVRETHRVVPSMVQRVVEDMVPHFNGVPQFDDMPAPKLSLAGNL